MEKRYLVQEVKEAAAEIREELQRDIDVAGMSAGLHHLF